MQKLTSIFCTILVRWPLVETVARASCKSGSLSLVLVKPDEYLFAGLCVSRTQQQRGNEGSGHAGGTQEHSMAQPEVSLWDPAEDHRSDGGQEAHHGGLDLHIVTVGDAIEAPVEATAHAYKHITDLFISTLKQASGFL